VAEAECLLFSWLRGQSTAHMVGGRGCAARWSLADDGRGKRITLKKGSIKEIFGGAFMPQSPSNNCHWFEEQK